MRAILVAMVQPLSPLPRQLAKVRAIIGRAIGQARVIDGDTYDIGMIGRIVMKRVTRAGVVLPEG